LKGFTQGIKWIYRMQEPPFQNTDARLLTGASHVERDRREAGIDGMVGDLAAVIISTEPDHFRDAVAELLATTGFTLAEGWRDAGGSENAVLRSPGSADLVLQSRRTSHPVFSALPAAPKARAMPSTRLETLVFTAANLEEYVAIQRRRGVPFLTTDILTTDRYRFIQTLPSPFTGNSLGYLEWEPGADRLYRSEKASALTGLPAKPDLPYLHHVGLLDHAATRVRAEDRDRAVLEFLSLTEYHFQFAIHVRDQNSVTTVARRRPEDYAMVFTSGITPFRDEATSGPTERFIHLYGPRVHHLAFRTDEIEATTASLKQDGMEFLIDLVGSPEEGIHQTFSRPSPHTMLVTEYLHRYGDFDGFFTESNVSRLTAATARQD